METGIKLFPKQALAARDSQAVYGRARACRHSVEGRRHCAERQCQTVRDLLFRMASEHGTNRL
jgi:hypothetical protein